MTMSHTGDKALIDCLADAYALENVGLRLLREGGTLVEDSTICEICAGHTLQTRGHLRLIEERLAAHEASVPSDAQARVRVGALRVELDLHPLRTPGELAISIYALENLEIGMYHVLSELARRSHDRQTEVVSQQILEQEEEAAELLAGTLHRACGLSAETLA
jgi:ferritin-like metal-binding protein YciE